jgi:hypothetical protein
MAAISIASTAESGFELTKENVAQSSLLQDKGGNQTLSFNFCEWPCRRVLMPVWHMPTVKMWTHCPHKLLNY